MQWFVTGVGHPKHTARATEASSKAYVCARAKSNQESVKKKNH